MNAGHGNWARTGLAALIAGVLVSQVALAGPPAVRTETVSRTIDVRGLDLSSPAGAQLAYRQIAAAARKICWDADQAYKGVARVKYQHEHAARCFEEAVQRALAQVAETAGIDLDQVAGSEGLGEAGLAVRR